MKRIFLLVPMIAMCFFVDAQRYQLWKVENGTATLDGTIVKRGAVLSDDDELCVDSAARLTFVDNEKVLYKYTAPGKQSISVDSAPKVCMQVKKMVNKKPNAFLKIITQIYDETIRVKKKHKTVKYLIPGGMERGNSVDMLHQSVYLSLRQIADDVYNKQTLNYSSDIALLKDLDVDACTFVIENRSAKQDYVVNILAVDMRNGSASLCLQFPSFSSEPYLVAMANTRLVLDETCFVESPFIRYFLFATTDAYDPSVIQMLLLGKYPQTTITVAPYSGYLLQQARIKGK